MLILTSVPRLGAGAGAPSPFRFQRTGFPVNFAGVAQLVEHLICNQRVGGSNPFASSTQCRESRANKSRQGEKVVWIGRSARFRVEFGRFGKASPVLRGKSPEASLHRSGKTDDRRYPERVECAKVGFGQWARRWAQVAEWLMAADCKSAVLWDYEGSNPSLCTSSCGFGFQ